MSDGEASTPAAAPLLVAEGISKRFGGVQAVSEVSFEVQPGAIYGLIGPNGAGKTTLFNLLTGLYAPDRGEFRFAGERLAAATPDRVAALGIARTFQNIRLFANLSALENVMIGRHVRTHAGILGAVFRNRATREEEAGIVRRARELLDYVGLGARADASGARADASGARADASGARAEASGTRAEARAGSLPYGDQRRLEIARALATEPKLIALDEPAAGMNPSERVALGALIRRIRDDGVTVLLIEHDVRLVMNLCDRVLVLDHGEKLAEGLPAEVQRDARVIEAYLGTPVAA